MKISIELEIVNQYEDDPDNEDHDGEAEMLAEFTRQMKFIITSVVEEGIGNMKMYDMRTMTESGSCKVEDF